MPQDLLNDLFDRLSVREPEEAEAQARAILTGLGFTQAQQEGPLGQLSGEQEALAVAVAAALGVGQPSVLLLLLLLLLPLLLLLLLRAWATRSPLPFKHVPQAAGASASLWRRRSSCSPTCCCWMSPPTTWTCLALCGCRWAHASAALARLALLPSTGQASAAAAVGRLRIQERITSMAGLFGTVTEGPGCACSFSELLSSSQLCSATCASWSAPRWWWCRMTEHSSTPWHRCRGGRGRGSVRQCMLEERHGEGCRLLCQATPCLACCSPLNAALPPSPAGDCGVQETAADLLHRQL